jgi:hypothetical protein
LQDYPTLSPDSSEYRALLPIVITVVVAFVGGLPLLLTAFLVVEQRRGYIEQVKAVQRNGASWLMLTRRQAALLQLCAPYRAGCWWMAPVSMLRRLVMAIMLVTIRSTSLWAWLASANTLFLALHLQLQPYERRRDNRFETLTLLSLGLQTTLLSVWPPPAMSRALFAALNALLLAPLLPPLLDLLSRRLHCTKRAYLRIDSLDG